MTQEKFTPAPWKRSDLPKAPTIVYGSHGKAICDCRVYHSKNDTQANMNLIATAPEMYEALKNLCDAIQEGDIQTISDRAINGIDTLKKARGEV